MFDLLIRNGLVIDGSGNPGYHATVGVEGEEIRVLRGDTRALPAARTIDGGGHVVCPGFIDMHSHGGLVILKEPLHEPKVRQGVTTELIGIDGNSHAPFKTREDLHRFGEYPSPRTYGCVPVILTEFVRAEKHLRLPEAIRKMTSFPAQRLELRDRGMLRDGMKADIVIFDPKTVKAPATPKHPKQYPLGIPYVIVNGKVVVDDGKHTGALPGRALRYGR